MIKIKIAGLTVGLDNKYSFIENVAKDYVSCGAADFTVAVTQSEIEEQRASFDGASDGYCESLYMYRHIAERLPEYDAFVFHGCVIVHGDSAYLFTAKSGVGKTTHAMNWLSEFAGKVHILNGDKPIIRFIDGIPYACGTPWQGKENFGVNEIVPLRAIVFLERGEVNEIHEIQPKDAILKFMNQVYLPTRSAEYLTRTMKNADRLLKSVPLYKLSCTKDKESARVSFDALTKNKKVGNV